MNTEPITRDAPSHHFALYGRASSIWSTALIVAIAFALLHTVLAWGRLDVHIWRDVGRWLHELERYTQGETPYRDFVWLYPPLSLWLIGGVTRVFSADLLPVWIITATTYVLICVTFSRYVALLVPRVVVTPVVLGGLLLSAGYAQNSSAALPLGMYTPAAPIGFLFLLAASILVLRLLETASSARAVLAGALCGAVVLTKQDFWLPAAYLVGAGGIIMWRVRAQHGLRDALLLAASSLLVMVVGVVTVGTTAGWQHIPGIISGFGNTSEVGGHSLPSGFRITSQVFVICALTLWLHFFARVAGVGGLLTSRRLLWSTALLLCAAGALIFVVEYLRLGAGLSAQSVSTVLSELGNGVIRQLLPILLTVLSLGVLIVRWRHFRNPALRNTVAFLLGLCLMSGVRRGFEYTEWFHFLLALPAFVLLIQLLLEGRAQVNVRATRVSFAALLLVGLYAHWYWGIGPLTSEPDQIELETPHGVVLVGRPIATQYAALERTLSAADPSGERPLLSFGYSGSFNYFMDRPPASPLTAGFRLSDFDAQTITNRLVRAQSRLLLIDVERFKTGRRPIITPLSILSWRLPTRPSFFVRFDRRFFTLLVRACNGRPTAITNIYGRTVLTIFDCKRRNVPAKPAQAAPPKKQGRSR